MYPEEFAAAEMVARATGAAIDGDPKVGRHDVDLTLPRGRTIGLEVTRAADAAEIGTWAEIAKRRRDRHPLLARWWSVALRSGSSVKAAHKSIPPLLAGLENLGITEHMWRSDRLQRPSRDPTIRAIKSGLADAGVDHAYSVIPNDGFGGLSFVVHKDGGTLGPSDVIDAVQHEAWKSDNVAKLAEMPRDEAHLFVWIDYTNAPAHRALQLGLTPLPDPHLPHEVHTLWIAARTSSDAGGDWVPAAGRSLSPPGTWVPT